MAAIVKEERTCVARAAALLTMPAVGAAGRTSSISARWPGGRSIALDIGPGGEIVGWATGTDSAPRAVVCVDRRSNVADNSATADGAEHATLCTCAFEQAFVPSPPALATSPARCTSPVRRRDLHGARARASLPRKEPA